MTKVNPKRVTWRETDVKDSSGALICVALTPTALLMRPKHGRTVTTVPFNAITPHGFNAAAISRAVVTTTQRPAGEVGTDNTGESGV